MKLISKPAAVTVELTLAEIRVIANVTGRCSVAEIDGWDESSEGDGRVNGEIFDACQRILTGNSR
jgi:hypothetical protein